MLRLPDALRPLENYKQFIVFSLVWDGQNNKYKKIPLNPHTTRAFIKGEDWQHKPELWTDANTACMVASALGDQYGVGFLFTEHDPFFFVDIDKCLNPDNSTWSDLANTVMSYFPGAAIEVSQSGRGLHIFGQGVAPEHCAKNTPLGLEFYTHDRFVALTGTNAIGDASTNHDAALLSFVPTYFAPKSTANVEWSNEPVEGWDGIIDDNELIEKALSSGGAAAAFGGSASFSALWSGDEDELAQAYPDEGGLRSYDESTADAALAQHLAFWTGNNPQRIYNLMLGSGLVRDKWTEREDYLERTILRAVSLQDTFYGMQADVDTTLGDDNGAVKLRGSDAQIKYAERIRAEKLASCADNEKVLERLCKVASCKMWIDHKDKTAQELYDMLVPIEETRDPLAVSNEPELISGYQYLGASLQIEHFRGCAYIQDVHRIFTPNGALLKQDQFNATYGGYVFQMDETGDKTTRKAWEAFTESQILRFPKAETTCFRPHLDSGVILSEEGITKLNRYVPIVAKRVVGDASPFTNHVGLLFPDERDRQIILAYMAACVQHIGVKFQWCPLIQGAPGNGKTLLSRCVAAAVGWRYTHFPKAKDIAEKFNEWAFNRLFIGVQDIYVPESRLDVIETLKPMITDIELPIRAMRTAEEMGENYANWMLNSNHKDAVRKQQDDRRFGIFYCPQQSKEDVIASGMTGAYFKNLYDWLKNNDGYAIVANYLAEYAIPDEFNPANGGIAPETSSTNDAIVASRGSIEQEILEAIAENRPGFANGWVSSMALERLLQTQRLSRAIPRGKRAELLATLGYYPHPNLPSGRVNNATVIDGGRTVLFIPRGHINGNLTTAAEIAKQYETAQTTGGGNDAGAVFGNVPMQ